jgi:acyl dehydratase
MNYITDQVKALIGAETSFSEAPHPVESSEVRRFHQATMDDAPRYWDADWAAKSRYGGLVAPAAFPALAFRRAVNTPDPMETVSQPDSDGVSRAFRGLPTVEVPLPRLLNGGYEYEFFRYAKPGERIARKSRYKNIYQRDGKSGPMVFVVMEEFFKTTADDPLLVVRATSILR